MHPEATFPFLLFCFLFKNKLLAKIQVTHHRRKKKRRIHQRRAVFKILRSWQSAQQRGNGGGGAQSEAVGFFLGGDTKGKHSSLRCLDSPGHITTALTRHIHTHAEKLLYVFIVTFTFPCYFFRLQNIVSCITVLSMSCIFLFFFSLFFRCYLLV